MNPTVFKKICLLGDFAVGKTSLVRRYVDDQFSDEYLSTIGVKLSRKAMQFPQSDGGQLHIQLVLWDLEGKQDFSVASDLYLRGASGAIIVGDVTRPETIANIRNHVSTFLTVNPKAFIAVAYNKDDLVQGTSPPINTSFEEHERVSVIQRTSAKAGSGVAPLFESLTKKIVEP